MCASRRLPLATLARVSGGRRRGGKARVALALVVLVAACGAGYWYLRDRAMGPDPVQPVDELVPDTASPASSGPGSATADAAAGTVSPLTFTASGADATSATATPTAQAASGGPSGAPGPVLAKPTRPAPETTAPSGPPEPPPIEDDFRPRLPRDVFEAQVSLARDAICPGAIDGAWGSQTRNAVAAFQQKHGLRVTGQLDNPTREALKLNVQPLRHYVVTEEDVARLRPWPKGWMERSELDFMGYSTVLEAVSERHLTHPNHLKRLNPHVDWNAVPPGTRLVVPNIGTRAPPPSFPEYILISLSAKTLQLYDASDALLAHFPCSIARRVEKRPVGELSILTVAANPNYTFNPETFPDSPDAQKVGRKLILQPGPNNPVGTAWIALSAGDGSYGIHGSPEPEKIGRTESSGCFRLANWNAEYLLPLVRTGMLVRVEP